MVQSSREGMEREKREIMDDGGGWEEERLDESGNRKSKRLTMQCMCMNCWHSR